MEKFKCARCGSCCRKYWVVVMPDEAKAIAKFLGLQLKDFIADYCSLYLDLFPASPENKALRVNSSFLPKKVYKALSGLLAVAPENLLVLPCITLRMKNNLCIFYDEKLSSCRIYKYRPLPCTLFPFLSLEEDLKGKKWSELYPFCKALQKCSPARKNFFRDYYPFAESYFKELEKKGIRKAWKTLPEKGIACYKGAELCNISLEEFLQAIETIN